MARVLPYMYRDVLNDNEHYELQSIDEVWTVYAHDDQDAIDFAKAQDLVVGEHVKLIQPETENRDEIFVWNNGIELNVW